MAEPGILSDGGGGAWYTQCWRVAGPGHISETEGVTECWRVAGPRHIGGTVRRKDSVLEGGRTWTH